MTETDDLTALRSAVAEFEESQKLTFAAFLISECNPNFGLKVEQEKALENVFTASVNFSVGQKLSFAIELLRFCRDKEEEEEDRPPDQSDYEGEEYYNSNRPLLDGYDSSIYHGCDGDDFNP